MLELVRDELTGSRLKVISWVFMLTFGRYSLLAICEAAAKSSLILWLRNPRPQFGILSQPHQFPEAGALGYRSCIPYSIFCVLSVPLRLFSQRARAVRSFGSAVAERHALPSCSYLLPRVLIFSYYLSIKKMHRPLRVLGESAVMGNHANGCSTLMQLGEKLHDCVPVLAV